jgi:hypothetical protein
MKGWVTWTGCAILSASLIWQLTQFFDIPGMLFDIGLIVMVIGLGRKIEKE